MTTISRISRLGLAAGGLALLLTACGGGGGGGDGVASLSGATDETTATTTATDAKATEEQVLAWVQCMRDQGLDIADPTVDSDGNLVLGGGPRPGAGAGAGAVGGTTGTRPDRSVFEKATETCGSPPQTGGGFSEEDRQAMQDSMLAMAQCLRDEGLDVADPDFSAQGPGGPPPSDDDATDETAARRRGPFGDLDMNDATVQAAFTSCQAKLGTTFPGRPGAAPTTTTGGNS